VSGQGGALGLAGLLLSVLLGCDEAEPSPAPEHAVARAQAPVVSTIVPAQPELLPEQPRCELVEPPQHMVDLAKAIPSAIVLAGYHGPNNFTGAPLPGYEAAGAWLERDAAQALGEVADALAREQLRLIIYDAYRPRSASVAMVEWARAHDHEWLIEDGWVAPRSEHNRGLALDVGLADAHGDALDMGSAWDQFDRSSFVRGVEGEALARRLRLRAAMVNVGFVPYQREWWHFAYRDRDDGRAPALDRPYTCR
jgi:D-alanyl-D-alanine dipeptidase